MQEPLIREIALQIVREQFFENWMLYALLAAIALLSSVASAFIVSYVRKRADTYATKADLDEVLRQIRKTTEVTEEVRTSISHADWVTREWKSIRRTKLEELLEQTYATEHWLDEQRGIWIFQKGNKSLPSPADKVSQLSTLYFPEIEGETSALVLAQREALSWIVDTAQKALATGNDLAGRQAVHTQSLPEWTPRYKAVLLAISAIQSKAQTVMKSIVGA